MQSKGFPPPQGGIWLGGIDDNLLLIFWVITLTEESNLYLLNVMGIGIAPLIS